MVTSTEARQNRKISPQTRPILKEFQNFMKKWYARISHLLPGYCQYGKKAADLCRTGKKKPTVKILSVNSGIGIRTPTYRVRVCCATFTQYRYLYSLSGKFRFFVSVSSRRIRLYHIRFPLSTPFLKKVEKILQEFSGWIPQRKVCITLYRKACKVFRKNFSHHLAKRKRICYTIQVSPIRPFS